MGGQLKGKNGAVGAGRKGSEEAGRTILEQGGNAVDAGVAVVLALSVTDWDEFCFGGEVPILIHMAERKDVVCVNGQGPAPGKATLEAFEGMDTIPGSGILPAAIPGALGACILALDRFGTRTFREVARPAMELLSLSDKEWTPRLARTLNRLSDAEKERGKRDRKTGLEAVRHAFYEGSVAEDLVRWNQEEGGLFTLEDMANHGARIEEPVHGTYRGYDVYKCGFWTQGPVMVQALNILELFDVGDMDPESPSFIHWTVEALKLAFADRDTYYGDPYHVDVPAEELLSKSYAEMRAKLIHPKKASLEHLPGDPASGRPVLEKRVLPAGAFGESRDTTTCVAADQWGNAFVATPSGWGSGVNPGTTGVMLGTRLQSFNVWEGHPNCIAPGKLPRITLTPTLILKDGSLFSIVSVAGGDQQEQTALQMVLHMIDHGMSAQEAADSLRFGTNHLVGSFRQTPLRAGSLALGEPEDLSVVEELKDMGHRLKIKEKMPSRTVLILRDKDHALFPGGDLDKDRHLAVL